MCKGESSMSEHTFNKETAWYTVVMNFIISLFNSKQEEIISNEVDIEIKISTNIVLRTQLICEYISEEIELEFNTYDFLMLLYTDFIRETTKKYDPLKVYKELNRNYNDTLKICYGNQCYKVERSNEGKKLVIITMDKSIVMKGQLILDELNELYGFQSDINNMIHKIWVNFIEKYKRGDNNAVLKNIIKMLKANQ